MPRLGMPARVRPAHAVCALLVVAAALSGAGIGIARAAAPRGLPADASCAALAARDPTATNGPEWGRALLSGHGVPGGWFGVDVCGNGIDRVAPGGANVSCDRVPAGSGGGCPPGAATFDGFGLSFQCVELVVRFAAWAFGDQPSDWRGNAPDLWLTGNHPADFGAIPDGSARPPVPGDILVWGAVAGDGSPWPAGPAGAHDGHVAVVASVGEGQLVFVEQNALSGGHNIPSETVALTHAGSRWAVAGSGGGRGLYGWLHSARNTGVFTGAGAVPGAVTPTSAPPADSTIQAPPPWQGLVPSPVGAPVVTAAGTLADVAFPSGGTNPSPAGPGALVRGLGAPPGARLAPDQTPAVVVSSGGTRDVFARAADGGLVDAALAPAAAGAAWRALGTPPGVALAGPVTATALPSGVAVGAVGSDGGFWWRAGPADDLGAWVSVGRPAATPLLGGAVLAGMPGSGDPMVLARGGDGRLYEADWQDISATDAGWSPGWNRWAPLAPADLPPTLAAPLVPVFELPAHPAAVGQWTDLALDVLARDAAGHIWLLHRGVGSAWLAGALPGTAPAGDLIGAVAVPPADGAPGALLHLYLAGPHGLALGTLRITPAGAVASVAWQTSRLPSNAAPPSAGQVVALAPDLSLLVSAAGLSVQLTGVPAAVQLAAPASASPATGAAPTPLATVVAGSVPAPPPVASGCPR